MICPNCQANVDPVASGHWVDVIIGANYDEVPREERIRQILAALYLWDQSGMYCRWPDRPKDLGIAKDDNSLVHSVAQMGSSVLPTELRDALFGLLCELGMLKTDEGGRTIAIDKRLIELHNTGGIVDEEVRKRFGYRPTEPPKKKKTKA